MRRKVHNSEAGGNRGEKSLKTKKKDVDLAFLVPAYNLLSIAKEIMHEERWEGFKVFEGIKLIDENFVCEPHAL